MSENHTNPTAEISVCDVRDDAAYNKYLDLTKAGIELVPEPYGVVPLGLKADGADFAKWIKQNHPEFPIALPAATPKIALHSVDVWLPLIYLAGDTSMQIFLNMAASYLYDKVKGKLPSDKPKLHMAVMYQNKRDGVTKKFEFSGDVDSLSKAIKRFDLDNFFNDDA